MSHGTAGKPAGGRGLNMGLGPREKQMSSVRYYDWIAHFGRRTPDKIALIDLGSQRRFSYAELDARISRLATYLRDSLKIARVRTRFAVWLPDPLTVAAWMVRSLVI